MMKVKEPTKKVLSSGIKVSADLNDKYAGDSVFMSKKEKANHILNTIGPPKI